eukprot:PhM_4_TR1323/c0_g1_i1/m.101051/K06699/PSME4; proteasome activator subunit 4
MEDHRRIAQTKHMPASLSGTIEVEAAKWKADIPDDIVACVAAKDWDGVSLNLKRLERCHRLKYTLPPAAVVKIAEAMVPVMLAPDELPPWYLTSQWTPSLCKCLNKHTALKLNLDWAAVHRGGEMRVPAKSALYELHTGRVMVLKSVIELFSALQPHQSGELAVSLVDVFESSVCPHFSGDTTLAFLRLILLYPFSSASLETTQRLVQMVMKFSFWKSNARWHEMVILVLQRVARYCHDFVWDDDVVDNVFDLILHGACIPAGCPDGYPKYKEDDVSVFLSETEVDARLIICLLAVPDTKSRAWVCFERMLRSTDVLYNSGHRGVASSRAHMVSSTVRHFLLRLQKQTKLGVPPEKHFGDVHIDAFTRLVMPTVSILYESKLRLSAFGSSIVRHLCRVCPKVVCECFLSRAVEVLNAVTDADAMRNLFDAVSVMICHGVSTPALVGDVLPHVGAFLENAIDSIDANNIRRTTAALSTLRNVFARIPLQPMLSTSSSPEGEDGFCWDNAHALCASFPDMAALYLQRMFLFTTSYTESKLTFEVEKEVRLTTEMFFASASPEILDQCLQSTLAFIQTTLCLSTRKIPGNILSALVSRQPERTLRMIVPVCLRGMGNTATGEHVNKSDVLWFGYHLARSLSSGRAAVLPFLDDVQRIAINLLKTNEKATAKIAGKLIGSMLHTVCIPAPMEYFPIQPTKSNEGNMLTCPQDPRQWGKMYNGDEVSVSWHVPSDSDMQQMNAVLQHVFEHVKTVVESQHREPQSKKPEDPLPALVLFRYCLRRGGCLLSGTPWLPHMTPKIMSVSPEAQTISFDDVITLCEQVVVHREVFGVNCLKQVSRILFSLFCSHGGTSKRKMQQKAKEVSRLKAASDYTRRGLRLLWIVRAQYNLLQRYVSLPHLPDSNSNVLRIASLLGQLSLGSFSVVRKRAQNAMRSFGNRVLRPARRDQITEWITHVVGQSPVPKDAVTGFCHLIQLDVYKFVLCEDISTFSSVSSAVLALPTYDLATLRLRVRDAFSSLLASLWECEARSEDDLARLHSLGRDLVTRATDASNSWPVLERVLHLYPYVLRTPSRQRCGLSVDPSVATSILHHLGHEAAQIRELAINCFRKLSAVYRTRPKRVTAASVPPSSQQRVFFVDRPAVGFSAPPPSVTYVDYTAGSEEPAMFAPSDAQKEALRKEVAASLDRSVLGLLIQRRAQDGKVTKFSMSTARFWKGVFRLRGIEGLDDLEAEITQLIEKGFANSVVTEDTIKKTDELNQTCRGHLSCALEIVAGLLRAARHWQDKQDVIDRVWDVVLRVTSLLCSPQGPQESMGDLLTALNFGIQGLDPARSLPLRDHIKTLDFNSDNTQTVRKALQLANLVLSHAGWRCREDARHFLDVMLGPIASHPYAQIRTQVALVATTCVQLLWDPNSKSDGDHHDVFTEFLTRVHSDIERILENSKSAASSLTTSECKELIAMWGTCMVALCELLRRAIVPSAAYAFPLMIQMCTSYLDISGVDVTDEDLVTNCQKIMSLIAHTRTTSEQLDLVICAITRCLYSKLEQKQSKVALLLLAEGIVYSNQFRISEPRRREVIDACAHLLDDSSKTVRTQASNNIAILIRIQSRQDLLSFARASSLCCTNAATRLKGVNGLRAVVLGYPESVPTFVPKALVAISRYSGDKDTNVSATVKDTFVQWWRVHYDAWRHGGQSEQFTEEQREIVLHHNIHSSTYFL